MKQNKNKPDLKEFCNSLVLLAGMEAKLKNKNIDTEFVEQIKIWAAGLFRLVVIGEVKKGKSSFINALLGVKDLVPVSSDVATSTIYKICYGKEISYKVFFTPNSNKNPITIPASELAKYGTEDGNPKNEKEVDFIQVFVPSPLLQSGLVIIDTPGLGGLFQQHKKITYQYIPRADAVFMVSDSVESPIGKEELNYLTELQKITNKIYFVQTKSMSVSSEVRESRRQNNCSTIKNHCKIPTDKLHYFVVDSHLKFDADENKDVDDLVDSGFIPLLTFINNEIKSNIQTYIMDNALQVALPKYLCVNSYIKQYVQIHEADTIQKQKELQKRLSEADDELKKWQENLPILQEHFQNGIRKIQEYAQENLKYCRPNGEMHSNFDAMIENATDMQTLLLTLEQINDNLPNVMAEHRYEITNNINMKIDALLNDIQNDFISIAKITITRASNTNDEIFGKNRIVDRIIRQISEHKSSKFEDARTAFIGFTVSISMLSIVGGILGSVLPGVGTILGSSAGMAIAGCFGAKKSLDIKRSNDIKIAKNQAFSGLQVFFSSIYQNILEDIQKSLDTIERKTAKKLKEAVLEKQNELKNHREELQKRQRATTNELVTEKSKIEQLQKEFAIIERIFTAM